MHIKINTKSLWPYSILPLLLLNLQREYFDSLFLLSNPYIIKIPVSALFLAHVIVMGVNK